jgi:hypothetical protein
MMDKRPTAIDEAELTPKQIAEANAIPVAVILDDPSHPLHAMTKSLMDRLESGEICLS